MVNFDAALMRRMELRPSPGLTAALPKRLKDRSTGRPFLRKIIRKNSAFVFLYCYLFCQSASLETSRTRVIQSIGGLYSPRFAPPQFIAANQSSSFAPLP